MDGELGSKFPDKGTCLHGHTLSISIRPRSFVIYINSILTLNLEGIYDRKFNQNKHRILDNLSSFKNSSKFIR